MRVKKVAFSRVVNSMGNFMFSTALTKTTIIETTMVLEH